MNRSTLSLPDIVAASNSKEKKAKPSSLNKTVPDKLPRIDKEKDDTPRLNLNLGSTGSKVVKRDGYLYKMQQRRRYSVQVN